MNQQIMAAPSGAWHWETAPAIAPAVEPAWRALTAAQSPLADAGWVRCFADAFAAPRWTQTIHLLYRGDQLVVGLPLVHRSGLADAWESYENEHHPYWTIAGELDEAGADAVVAHLARRGYLFLRRLHLEGATCAALIGAAQRRGLRVSRIRSEHGDARIAVRGTWDEFRAALPKDYRDLPRKQRQLERAGRLMLQAITASGPELDSALRECFDVEQRGWKGSEGAPIQRDPRTLRFYRELPRALAERDAFRLFVLRLDGKAIAFQYCLVGGGQVELLKESYDPVHAAKSPGHLLRLMVLRQLFEAGDIRWYHMGRATVGGDRQAEWKLRWATEVAPLCTLRIYGPRLRARAAYLAGPVLRTQLKRSALFPVILELRGVAARGRSPLVARARRGMQRLLRRAGSS